MLYAQIFDFCQNTGDEALNTGKNIRPIYFMLDEFGNLGKIPNFANFVALIRSAKCSISILIQSLQQIQKVYGQQDAETIINNLNSKILMGGVQSLQTLNLFSKLMGQATIERTTINAKEKGEKMARDLMTPDELRRLKEGDSILLISNKPPIKMEMMAFYENERFNKKMQKSKKLRNTNKSLGFNITDIDIQAQKIQIAVQAKEEQKRVA